MKLEAELKLVRSNLILLIVSTYVRVDMHVRVNAAHMCLYVCV